MTTRDPRFFLNRGETKPHLGDGAIQYGRYLEILTLRSHPWAEKKFKTAEEQKAKPPSPYSAEELEGLLRTLPDIFLPEALLQAGLRGETEIGQRLIELRGHIPIELEQERYQTFLNGGKIFDFLLPTYLGCAADSEAIANHLEWLSTVGLGALVGLEGNKSTLFSEGGISAAAAVTRSQRFQGELPILRGGKVERPELLISLAAKKAKSAFPISYDRILCWAPASTVVEFEGELKPFRTERVLRLKPLAISKAEEIHEVRLKDVSTDIISSIQPALGGADYNKSNQIQDIILRTTSTDAVDRAISDCVLSTQANLAIQHGFWPDNGLVLCQASLEFLAQFDAADVEMDALDVSEGFAQQYCPLDLISKDYMIGLEGHTSSRYLRVGYEFSKESDTYSTNELARRFALAGDLGQSIADEVGLALVEHLVKDVEPEHVLTESWVSFQKQLGLKSSDYVMKLKLTQVAELHDLGFEFSKPFKNYVNQKLVNVDEGKQGAVFIDYVGLHDFTDEEIAQLHDKACKSGIWSAPISKPNSLAEALTALSRRRHYSAQDALAHNKLSYELNANWHALTAMLRNAGVEECVEAAAVSVLGWKALAKAFTTHELSPYFEKAPLKARKDLFTIELGI